MTPPDPAIPPGPVTPLDRWEGRSTPAWARRLGVATAEFHARIGSTSDRARELVEQGRPLPAFVLADRQLAGRGRRGRRWASDSPLGLWFTVARTSPGAAAAATLPLRVGLAVVRALDAIAPEIATQVKWPNDIVVSGRKLGGILCERARGAVLVGVGINLNHPANRLPADLTPPATSLRLRTGRPTSRARAVEQLADRLHTVWSRPTPEIPPDELEALNARSALRGRPLTVNGVVRRASGSPRRVDALSATGDLLRADGTLEVRDEGGARLRVIAGSVESWS